ncbi:baseplate J/gp47 family protein [uncultured Helicobacter sp.]|uniref:baseplate J/gp47 family protein n=1 Tax=uncultured Helicobacter sp. TaxID=175537 RepID=UPI00374EBAB1
MSDSLVQMPTFLKPLNVASEREAIISDFTKALKDSKGIDYEPTLSDDYNILISCILYRLGLKIDELNYIIANNYLEYSSGEYLDALVKLLGLERFKGSEPLATLSIMTKEDTFLSKGAKFVSSDGATSFAIKDYELKADIANEIIVQGDKEGKWETTILEIKNPLITEIAMLSDFVIYEKGESDEDLKTRFKNALASFSTAGSVQSYTHYASVEGVGKVKAFSVEKGVVTIAYYGDNAGAEELISQNLEGNVPLTDKIIIKKVEPTIIDLDITLTLSKEADFTLLQDSIAKNIQAFFNALEIGEAVALNKVISLCFVSEHIINAEVVEFVPLSEDSIYELNKITIKKV